MPEEMRGDPAESRVPSLLSSTPDPDSSRLTPDTAIPQNHPVRGQNGRRGLAEIVRQRILAWFLDYDPALDAGHEPQPDPKTGVVAEPGAWPEFGSLSLPSSGPPLAKRLAEIVHGRIRAWFLGNDPELDPAHEPQPGPEAGVVAEPEAWPEFGSLSLPSSGPPLAKRLGELKAELQFLRREAWLASRESLLSFFLGPGWLPSAEPLAKTQLHTVQLSRGLTGRSLGFSFGLHILFLATPLPVFLTLPGQRPGVEMVKIENDLQWVPTSRVLPPITPTRRAGKRPSPGGKANQPLPPLGADSKQRQAIVSTPPKPNHPTQTLIQQFALDKTRVDARRLRVPNMVTPPGPAPTPEIDLRRLRIPDAPVDLSGPPRAPLPPRPKSRAELALREKRLENLLARLTLPTSRSTAGVGASDAPDVSAPLGPARSGDLVPHGVLALSANPDAPGAVLRLPDMNLRARIVSGPYTGAGSPGGVPGGVPGAEGGSGGGPGGFAGGPGGGLTAPDIFVAPAGAVPAGPIVVGPGGQSGLGTGGPPPPPPAPRQVARSNTGSSDGQPATKKSPEQRGRDLLAAIHPGAQSPSEGARRRVYVTYLFLSALTSQSSSWFLQYSEFPGNNPAGVPADAPVVGPQVARKVDPCYSADAHWERVEGTVLLYAVIRADGGVEDVVTMRSLAQKIDERAIAAFQNSRFEPARKAGQAVPVEALVEIPFRLAPCM